MVRSYVRDDGLEITGVRPRHPRDWFKDRLRKWKQKNRLRKRDVDDAEITQVRPRHLRDRLRRRLRKINNQSTTEPYQERGWGRDQEKYVLNL